MSYWHVPTHENITIQAEVADSLMGPWSSAAEDVEQRWQVTPPAYYEFVTARDKTPVAAAPQRFMRLKVSHP
jgi:hypothetical protein